MKAEPVIFYSGALSIQLIGETEFETTLLQKAFEAGNLKRGNGDSKCPGGTRTGFYIDLPFVPATD